MEINNTSQTSGGVWIHNSKTRWPPLTQESEGESEKEKEEDMMKEGEKDVRESED